MPTLRSPRYNIPLESGTITAGGEYYKDLSTVPECAQQIPYNNLLIRNFSSCRYRIEYGQTVAVIGSSEVYADDEAYGLKSIKITNINNTLQDDLIYITISREVSQKAAIIAHLTGGNLYEIANGDI